MWQMFYLFTSPQKVFRDFAYRKRNLFYVHVVLRELISLSLKETKNQFARDDPAFVVLLSLVLICTSILFALVMRLSFLSTIEFIIWVVMVDCIGVGLLIATIYWYISNKFLIKTTGATTSPDVEWAYCFDIHLNAFLPLIVVLHLFQLPFLMSNLLIIAKFIFKS